MKKAKLTSIGEEFDKGRGPDKKPRKRRLSTGREGYLRERTRSGAPKQVEPSVRKRIEMARLMDDRDIVSYLENAPKDDPDRKIVTRVAKLKGILKSIELFSLDDLHKAGPHKYIRRLGAPKQYTYTYAEPFSAKETEADYGGKVSDEEIAMVVHNVLSKEKDQVKYAGEIMSILISKYGLTMDELTELIPKVKTAVAEYTAYFDLMALAFKDIQEIPIKLVDQPEPKLADKTEIVAGTAKESITKPIKVVGVEEPSKATTKPKPEHPEVIAAPNETEWQHEKMRISSMMGKDWSEGGKGEQKLITRMNRITHPSKMLAFALALENENIHNLAGMAYDKLREWGYDWAPPAKKGFHREDIRWVKKAKKAQEGSKTVSIETPFAGRRIDVGKSLALIIPLEKGRGPDKTPRKKRGGIKYVSRNIATKKIKDGIWEADFDERAGSQEMRNTTTGERFTVVYKSFGKAIRFETPFEKGRGKDKQKRKKRTILQDVKEAARQGLLRPDMKMSPSKWKQYLET